MSESDRMAHIVEKGIREVYVFDAKTLRIEYINDSVRQNTGYSSDELRQRTPLTLLPDYTRQDFQALIDPLCEQRREVVSFETSQRRKDGTTYPVDVAIRYLADHQHPAFVAYVSDITAQRAQEEQLRTMAYFDQLTDLPNRVLLQDRLRQALAEAERYGTHLALMFLDLDRFKVINDTLGHRTGDLLLAAVAQRLTAAVRRTDTVARLGGDEFAVIYASCGDASDVAVLAERIIGAFSTPFPVENHQVFIGTSVGITLSPADGREVDRLLQNADLAMYRAKELGGNTAQFFTASLNVAAQERLTMETDLRQALDRKEFVVYYQPQVDLATGEIVGVEALVRWQHPTRGLLDPEQFLPIAQDSGLIVPIGEWVLRESCRQNRLWQQAGLPPLLVAVNLSAPELKQPNLGACVMAALKEAGLEPTYLELELTEDLRGPAPNLNDLHRSGIKLAIDDVGTGYSPLSYLKRFPVHKVKIDRSFVRDLTTDPNSAAMTRGIVALAHSLHLKVVAEGVETAAQLALLRKTRCDLAQGYYFSPALPAPALDRLLREVVRSTAGLSFGSASAAGVWEFWSRQPRAAA